MHSYIGITLFLQVKLLQYLLVDRGLPAPKIIKQFPPLRHHLQKPAPRMVIFRILLEMLRELLNGARKDPHLDIGRAGILLVAFVLVYDFRLYPLG